MNRVCLITAGLAMTGFVSLQGASPDTWVSTGPMVTATTAQTSTALTSGVVLVAGGCGLPGCGLNTAATYNPATGAWTATGNLTTGRYQHIAALLRSGQVLVAGGCVGNFPCTAANSAELYNPVARTWTGVAPMNSGRDQFAAVILSSGMVLVSGGNNICNSRVCNTLASAELYSPATNTWSYTGNMTTARQNHTMTLLPNGQVLVTGGCPTNGLGCDTQSAELYNPATGVWTGTSPMNATRTYSTAVLLANGKVLVAGGLNSGGYTLSSAELYDPTANTWTITGSLITGRYGLTSTLLQDGTVLIANGAATAELYVPAAGEFVNTGTPSVTGFVPTLLQNGNVLASGGANSQGVALTTAQLYEPGPAPLITLIPTSLSFGYQQSGVPSAPQTVTLTNWGTQALTISSATFPGPAGSYFSASGSCTSGTVAPSGSCQYNVVFTPGTGALTSALALVDNAPDTPQTVSVAGIGFLDAPLNWITSGNMSIDRSYFTLTALPNGDAIAAGGSSFFNGPLSSTDLYNSLTNSWTPGPPMPEIHSSHTATWLPSGLLLIAGGGTSAAALYNPSTNSWNSVALMREIRSGHTATLLKTNLVLVTGGCAAPCVPAELYDPSSNSWTAAGNMVTLRTGHTASLLANGKVLIAGGIEDNAILSSAELYDPQSNSFTSTGSMSVGRENFTASVLSNGQVLAAGGAVASVTAIRSAELYNPVSGVWTVTGSMKVPRYGHTATHLGTGNILVAGGDTGCDNEFGICDTIAFAEIYSVAAGTWSSTTHMLYVREFQAATVLPNGNTLEAGGLNLDTDVPVTSAESFVP